MAKKTTIDTILTTLLEKTDKQYEDLDKRLDNIEKVMIAQEINLAAHMKRSEHLETIIQTIQENDLKPIQTHINRVEGGLKLLGLISLFVGIVSGIYKIIN